MALSRAQRELIDEAGVTEAEAKAITALQRLARTWPQTLRLASMGGQLHVIRTGDEAFEGSYSTSVERQEGIIADIDGIPNTGGDW